MLATLGDLTFSVKGLLKEEGKWYPRRMKSVSMNIDVEYLLTYLKDELQDIPNLRIHPVAPSTTQKSVDLPQDYDPNSNDVHLKRGVRIRMSSREFFFPAQWVRDQRLDLVYSQVAEIRKFTHD